MDKSEMLGKDFEAYKAIYCSLCKQLGKDYSFLTRFILSYDCTFYAVIALSLTDNCCGFCSGKCKFNPLKKCNYIKSGEEALSKAAALSIVSVYYKLKDNIADGSFFEKLLCYLMMPFFSHWRKKALKKYPEIEKAVAKMSFAQFEVEKDKSCSIDKAAEPTANMLSDVLTLLVDDDDEKSGQKRRVLSSFGYFLGKWIYLIDAANDFEDDLKKGCFNPYIIAYGNDKVLHLSDINSSLDHCLSECLLSYNLLEIKHFNRIVDNVLIYGLPKKQKSILYKEKELKHGE
ncbi:MAG: hypothetical protein IJO20_07245 [Ruminococcus sp.]|nr:hypothetical protein [Ruminococcus sp.]